MFESSLGKCSLSNKHKCLNHHSANAPSVTNNTLIWDRTVDDATILWFYLRNWKLWFALCTVHACRLTKCKHLLSSKRQAFQLFSAGHNVTQCWEQHKGHIRTSPLVLLPRSTWFPFRGATLISRRRHLWGSVSRRSGSHSRTHQVINLVVGKPLGGGKCPLGN